MLIKTSLNKNYKILRNYKNPVSSVFVRVPTSTSSHGMGNRVLQHEFSTFPPASITRETKETTSVAGNTLLIPDAMLKNIYRTHICTFSI